MKPKNWVHYRFEDLFGLKHGFAFPSEGYSDQGAYILLTPGNFFEDGGFRDRGQNEKFFVGPIPEEYVLNDDDVLVVMTEQAEGLLGSAANIPTSGRYLHNQRLGRLVELHIDKLSKEYLYFLFNSLPVRRRISVTASGTKVRHTSPDKIGEVEVLLPPLPEQQKIADILGTWDEALEKLDALIAVKALRKQALMQQLLTGQRRLPGFDKPWAQATFGQFLTESRIEGSDGLTAQKITVKLYGRGVLAKQERMVGSSNTKYFVRRAGQLIYSKLDFLNGAFGIIPPELDGYESTLDLPSFDVKPSADARWLLAYLVRPEFYERQVGAAAGGRIARRINPPEFLKLRLKAPDVYEQRAIADVLDTADAELRLLRQQRVAIDQQKRGLMQQLLTGKKRTTP